MARKVLLSLDDLSEKRLLDLVDSYVSTGIKVTFSDVLRQGLFCLSRQQTLPFDPVTFPLKIRGEK